MRDSLSDPLDCDMKTTTRLDIFSLQVEIVELKLNRYL